ncbi:importin-9 [Quercus suber]|uniref:Importin-9 n=2 Tax=Quercus suber TaxID=58331 RepID=A0AAW0KHE5_QUESU
MVPALVPVLFPCLLTIVSSPQVYEKYIRTKALSIVYYCTSMLVAMSGVYKTETTALIGPMLKPWMDQFSIILEHPVQSEDPNDWSIRMEVLKCLNQFVQNLPGLTESEFMVIIRPLWETFVSSLGVYVRSSIEGTEDSFEGRYDSDGAEKSLDSYVIQVTLMMHLVGSNFYKYFILSNKSF